MGRSGREMASRIYVDLIAQWPGASLAAFDDDTSKAEKNIIETLGIGILFSGNEIDRYIKATVEQLHKRELDGYKMLYEKPDAYKFNVSVSGNSIKIESSNTIENVRFNGARSCVEKVGSSTFELEEFGKKAKWDIATITGKMYVASVI
jgi:hypothetical protein